jgi:hypothetical protein
MEALCVVTEPESGASAAICLAQSDSEPMVAGQVLAVRIAE